MQRNLSAPNGFRDWYRKQTRPMLRRRAITAACFVLSLLWIVGLGALALCGCATIPKPDGWQ